MAASVINQQELKGALPIFQIQTEEQILHFDKAHNKMKLFEACNLPEYMRPLVYEDVVCSNKGKLLEKSIVMRIVDNDISQVPAHLFFRLNEVLHKISIYNGEYLAAIMRRVFTRVIKSRPTFQLMMKISLLSTFIFAHECIRAAQIEWSLMEKIHQEIVVSFMQKGDVVFTGGNIQLLKDFLTTSFMMANVHAQVDERSKYFTLAALFFHPFQQHLQINNLF